MKKFTNKLIKVYVPIISFIILLFTFLGIKPGCNNKSVENKKNKIQITDNDNLKDKLKKLKYEIDLLNRQYKKTKDNILRKALQDTIKNKELEIKKFEDKINNTKF